MILRCDEEDKQGASSTIQELICQASNHDCWIDGWEIMAHRWVSMTNSMTTVVGPSFSPSLFWPLTGDRNIRTTTSAIRWIYPQSFTDWPFSDATPPTDRIHPFNKIAVTFKTMRWRDFDVLLDLGGPKPVQLCLFCDHLKTFWLGGVVKPG